MYVIQFFFLKKIYGTVAVCVFETMTQYLKVFFEWVLMIYNISREIIKVKKKLLEKERCNIVMFDGHA